MLTRITFLFLISTSFINAQIYTPNGTIQGSSSNSNIGIGTNNPTTKLTIQAGPDGYPTPLKAISIVGPNSPANANSAQDLSWDFAAAGSSAIRSYRGSGFDTYLQFKTNTQFGGNAPQVRMHIGENGNVGIGTTTPTQKLEINGNSLTNGTIISSVSGDIGGRLKLANPAKVSNQTASEWTILNMTGNYGNSLQFWAYDNLGCANGGMCTNRFTIMDNGNVVLEL